MRTTRVSSTKRLQNALIVFVALTLTMIWYNNNVVLELDDNISSSKQNLKKERNSVSQLPKGGGSPGDSSKKRSIKITDDRVPRFFLHIGPHKSATTSIQCALHANSQLLREERVIYVGKIDGGLCDGPRTSQYDKVRKIDECVRDDDGCWNELVKEWSDYRKQGYDIILSKESLSDWMIPFSERDSSAMPASWDDTFRSLFWKKLSSEALKSWDVTILLTYRHYYQWLPSAYMQSKYHQIQSNQPWPENQITHDFGQFLELVLDEKIPSPYPYVDSILKHKDSVFPASWKIVLLSLHNDENQKDIIHNIICDILDKPQTCTQLIPVSTKRTSPSEAVFLDRLNIQANNLRWLEGGKRFARMKQIRKFLSSEQNIQPSKYCTCPSKTLLKRFLQKSLSLQRELIKNDNKENMGDDRLTEQHVEGFWNVSQSFCSPNVTQLLLDNSDILKEFFKN